MPVAAESWLRFRTSPAVLPSLGFPQNFCFKDKARGCLALSQKLGQMLEVSQPKRAEIYSAQSYHPLIYRTETSTSKAIFCKHFFKSLKICIILSVTIYSFCISSNWHCCYFRQARKQACQELTWCVMSQKQKSSDKCLVGFLCGFPSSYCKL